MKNLIKYTAPFERIVIFIIECSFLFIALQMLEYFMNMEALDAIIAHFTIRIAFMLGDYVRGKAQEE